MALHAVLYRYADDPARLDEHRPRHKDYLASLFEQGRIVISGPLTTGALTELVTQRVGAGAVVLALHESADVALADMPVAQADSILLLVGPEGGISDEELAALSAAGARTVRLGPTVLRTSTAAAVALGALGVLTPRWALPS